MGVFPFVHPSRRWLHADVRNGIVKRVPRIAVGGRRVLWTVIVRRSTCSPLRLRCSMVGVLSSMCELSFPCNQPYFTKIYHLIFLLLPKLYCQKSSNTPKLNLAKTYYIVQKIM